MNSNLNCIFVAAALVAGTASAALAGSFTPGPYWDYVMPYGETVYFEVFAGGHAASITLDGDCYSDIDLWLYDEYGDLVSKSTSNGCQERVDFVPWWTGEFMIVVENHGKPNGSNYILTTY